MNNYTALIWAANTLILAGCSTTPGAWESSEVSSVTEVNMLREGGWKLAGLVHHDAGPDTYMLTRKVTVLQATF